MVDSSWRRAEFAGEAPTISPASTRIEVPVGLALLKLSSAASRLPARRATVPAFE